MGKKKKEIEKKLKKAIKKEQKTILTAMMTKGCKTKCCKKYKKNESKRCGRCPCFDLIKQVA